MSSSFFAPNYFAARDAFLALARERGAQVASYPLDARGPARESLSIDTAYFGPREPQRLLAIVSGTHGVEGFAGSALQRQWLHAFSPSLIPVDTGCLLIHALNAYGFAHLRRANEHNVDLNRNALGKFPGPANVGYRRFDAWLNPPSTPGVVDLFLPRGLLLAARHGWASLRQAIVEGQYEFPRGLFYGGAETAASTRILFDVIAQRTARAERVFFVDIHTGVGGYATHKLMVDFAEDSESYRHMQQWFGADSVVSNRPADSLAYRVSGGLTEQVAELLATRAVYACLLEFGTYSVVRTLACLHRENRAYHYGAATGTARRQAREALRDAFCPPDETWRRQVLAHGARLLDQAARACFTSSLDAGAP